MLFLVTQETLDNFKYEQILKLFDMNLIIEEFENMDCFLDDYLKNLKTFLIQYFLLNSSA